MQTNEERASFFNIIQNLQQIGVLKILSDPFARKF